MVFICAIFTPRTSYAELVKNAFVKDKFPSWKPILKVMSEF